MYELQVNQLARRFGARRVFSDISFTTATGQVTAVVGPNGSGKSTMLLTLLGEYRPTRGTVTFAGPDGELAEEAVRSACSLVSPYMNVYDSLSAEENIVFFSQLAGVHHTGKELSALLDKIGLAGRGADPVGCYSSGMKQRLKYALAVSNEPAFLFLDEPTSNLDEQGKAVVFELIREYKQKSVVVIATNEKEDRELADQFCRLGD
jgi:heme exporter protein A